MLNEKIRFVCATRKNESEFFEETLLGKCLKIYSGMYELDLYPSNCTGLSTIYNNSIKKSESNPAILVFVHDDVFLMNFWWITQIRESLNEYDLVGVAGNQRRQPNQATWAHKGSSLTEFDVEYTSGCVGHSNGFALPCALNVAGPAPREVKLLDGLFMACHSATLLRHNILFDPQFSFHFYDLDICRQFEMAGLRMGTWCIPLLHGSSGNPDELWTHLKDVYFRKWGE